jgi:5-methylthioadenosine/S-adenosylhomocysteine deaminase
MPVADLIIAPRWLIPVVPLGTVLENHAVAIHAGRIVELLPISEARATYPDAEWLDRPDHVLTAGFVNAHTHAAMSLLRGCADDMQLDTWLMQHIWPLEGTWVNAEFVRDGADLAIAEMIASGTTCFQDMYMFPDQVAAVAAEHGIRAIVSMIVIEAPTSWATTAPEYIEKGLAVHDRYRGHPLVKAAFGPHAPYTVGTETLKQIVTLANQLDVQVHMHVHETASEVEQAVTQNGGRPLAKLDDLGLVNAQLNAVHMTQLEDAEIAKLAETGAHVIHCPESNMKLASGSCRVRDLLRAGVNVALGTDGAASNNDLDMLGEMRSAALLAKQISQDAEALAAADALQMATLNGAKALALQDEIGSVEAGKSADLICIDLAAPATQPVLHPLSTLVYSATRDQVSDVWVQGRALYRDRRFVQCDIDDILARARAWGHKISAS